MFGVKCQITEGDQEQVEDIDTSSIPLNIIIQMTLMNTPKKEHCLAIDNLHSMNEHDCKLSTLWSILS